MKVAISVNEAALCHLTDASSHKLNVLFNQRLKISGAWGQSSTAWREIRDKRIVDLGLSFQFLFHERVCLDPELLLDVGSKEGGQLTLVQDTFYQVTVFQVLLRILSELPSLLEGEF